MKISNENTKVIYIYIYMCVNMYMRVCVRMYVGM